MTIKDMRKCVKLIDIEQHLGYEVYRIHEASSGSKHLKLASSKKKKSVNLPPTKKLRKEMHLCQMHVS